MLTSTIRSHSSTFIEAISESGMTPALLTMTSTRPQAWRAASANAATSARSVTSTRARHGLSAPRPDFLRERVQPVDAARAEHDLRAGGAELPGDGGADAAGSARDENDFVEGHGSSLSWLILRTAIERLPGS